MTIFCLALVTMRRAVGLTVLSRQLIAWLVEGCLLLLLWVQKTSCHLSYVMAVFTSVKNFRLEVSKIPHQVSSQH